MTKNRSHQDQEKREYFQEILKDSVFSYRLDPEIHSIVLEQKFLIEQALEYRRRKTNTSS